MKKFVRAKWMAQSLAGRRGGCAGGGVTCVYRK